MLLALAAQLNGRRLLGGCAVIRFWETGVILGRMYVLNIHPYFCDDIDHAPW